MARKKTISKEHILSSAYALVEAEGFSKFTARNVANKMKCSTQPIYLEFESMIDLRNQVLERIKTYLVDVVYAAEITGDLLVDLALNYVQFAQDEPVLYRTLYVENNLEGESFDQFTHTMFMDRMNQDEDFIKLKNDQKESLFVGSWIVATGIATLNAAGLYQPSTEQIIELVRQVDTSITTSKEKAAVK